MTVESVMDRPVLDTTASPQLVPVIEDSGDPLVPLAPGFLIW